jgi:hypothetical protein
MARNAGRSAARKKPAAAKKPAAKKPAAKKPAAKKPAAKKPAASDAPATAFVASAVAHVLEGCTRDSFRGAHVSLGLGEALALVGGPEVSRRVEEITYGVESRPTPLESVVVERVVVVGGAELVERIEVTEARRPHQTFLSMEWQFEARGPIGKAMDQAAREVKRELAARLRRTGGSTFSFERDGRTNSIFVSHLPTSLCVTLTDDDF